MGDGPAGEARGAGAVLFVWGGALEVQPRGAVRAVLEVLEVRAVGVVLVLVYAVAVAVCAVVGLV